MKKVTLLLFAIIMAVVSCSDKKNDPDLEATESGAVPVKIAMTSGGETDTYTITYQENKIDKVTRAGGGVETYVYDGDRIQKIHWGSASSSDYTSYSYDGSGRLIKEEDHGSNGNNDLTELSYSGAKAIVSGGGVGDMQVEVNYDRKGNFVSADLKSGGTTVGAVSITYDDKNAPFKNVLGWNKIRYLVNAPLGDNIGFEDIMGAGNNPLKLTGNMEGVNVEVNYTYEFKDTKNLKLPTKITGTKKVRTDSETFTAEITYK